MTPDQLFALQKQLTWYQLRADQELLKAIDVDLPMAQRRIAHCRRQHFLALAQEAINKAAVYGA